MENWTFKLRGEEVSLEIVDDTVAVEMDEDEIRERARRRAGARFSTALATDAKPGAAIPVKAAGPARLFESCGFRLSSGSAAAASPRPPRKVLLHNSGTLLIETSLMTVQLAPDVPEHRAAEELQADRLSIVRRLAFAPNAYEVRVPPNTDLRDLVYRLQQRPDRYRFAEPTFLQTLTRRQSSCDNGFERQWQHFSNGAGISTEKAWKMTRGGGRQIAVIDHGMQVGHPDLEDGIVGGGYFTSAASGSKFVRYQKAMTGFPDDSHGTFCLGMAGGRMHNPRGASGVAPESGLIPIACDRVGTMTTLARAIAHAAEPKFEDPEAAAGQGADVISCSLGPDGEERWEVPTILMLAIEFAAKNGRQGRGIPLFWAVNNTYRPIEEDKICSHELVIAVGRSNSFGQSDGSAFGSKLEFVAPGSDVYSCKSGGRYGNGSGTSFATPLAAGVSALILARYPDWTREQVLERLRSSCNQIGCVTYTDGRHPDYGYGLLNAELAVK